MSNYEISKSSLLSLKAEIIRKHEELKKVKSENEIKKSVLKKTQLDLKNKGVELREKNDETESNEDLLKQSKSILEEKANLYEKLRSGKLSGEDKEKSKHYLVRFDKKRLELDVEDVESENDDYQSDEDAEKDPGDKWVDYEDCFGRTRKCLLKDLEYFKSKDKELKKVVEEKKKNSESENIDYNVIEKEIVKEKDPSVLEPTPDEPSELISGDMRREMLRRQWEKEEEDLLKKSNIHYQDLLFGEARSHGVGYYSFSKDEEERAKQQEALKKLREETEMKQKKAQELRHTREQLLAARLKAARNRKRARMGLPPEEDDNNAESTQTNVSVEESINNEKQTEIIEKESLLAEARKKYVRPWDIGKEGVKEYPIMTQKEWIKKKRKERPKEFAPPTTSRNDFRGKIDESNEDDYGSKKSLKFTTKKSSNRNKNEPTLYEEVDQCINITPTPIEDLNIKKSYYERGTLDLESSKINKTKGVEIAPPPTYDYYGPNKKVRKNSEKPSDIQDSIEAGLKFLRKQIEEKQKSTNHPDDMFIF